MKKSQAGKPVSRSGRFESGPGADVAKFSESVSFDWRLWQQDIRGSLAHAAMLEWAGLIQAKEGAAIRKGLKEIEGRIKKGQFRWDPALEDVHMNIERALTELTPAGGKLHTGRSRNDQIATDMRMWVRDEIDALRVEIQGLQGALVEMGERNMEVVIPGYTHLQRAQPVYLAHHLLAYVEMLDRDAGRLKDCRARANVCPLGSGALAGSSLKLDREMVARLLGFVDERGQVRVSQNSMDAVSDRDFVVETCSAAALLAVHLSRLAEDLILWVSSEFGFIRLSDAYTTGSSLMPQKKNPDIAELARGKSGRVIGNLVSLLVLLKGLPMTYNRDLQEDKEPLFDTVDTVRATVRLLAGMLRQTEVNAGRCEAAAADPGLLATDLADYLVRRGVPFREAHHVVGAVVGESERRKKLLNELTLEELRKIDARFDRDALDVFELKKALALRVAPGCPGGRQVRFQLARWRKALGMRAGAKRRK